MRLFGFGLVTIGMGASIGLMASETDSYALMVASSGLRFAGMIMVVQSIRLFRGLRVWPWASIAVFASVTSVLFGRWLFISDNVALRTGVLSIAMSILAADGTISMFRQVSRRERLTHWSTGFVFAFTASFLAIRGIAQLSGAMHPGSLSHSAVEFVPPGIPAGTPHALVDGVRLPRSPPRSSRFGESRNCRGRCTLAPCRIVRWRSPRRSAPTWHSLPLRSECCWLRIRV